MSKRLMLIIGSVVVVAVVVGGALFWFLRDDAPDEVSLDSATESVAGAGESDGGSAAGDVEVAGTWTVDTESGAFDYESATGTFVGFRIEEELSTVGSTTAVGRTGDVSGSMEIDGTELAAASFDVDLSTITTNESRRDDKVQEALETGEFPTGTFELTEPVDLGEAAETGEAVSVTVVGDLTIHGVTKSIELPIEAQLVDDTIVVVGSTDITFSDFEVTVPSAPIVLSVEDTGTLELQLLLVKG